MPPPFVASSLMDAIFPSVFTPPSNGITGGYTGGNVNIERAMTAFAAIAWYNAAELIILVLSRFKRYEGLYFWSLLVTSFAIIVYEIGAWGNMNAISESLIVVQSLQNIGWIFMVVGQSLVLYSRLHIITMDRRVLTFVLSMIIFNAVILYIPTTTLNFGCTVYLSDPWIDGYNNMERVQMTIFSFQELAISAVYLREVRRFIKDWEQGTRKLMYELIAVNITLILLDVALLTVEFHNLYMIETTLKGAIYSIKLKLEVGVLSRMVSVMGNRKHIRQTVDTSDEINLRNYSSAQVANRWFSNPGAKLTYPRGRMNSQSVSTLAGIRYPDQSGARSSLGSVPFAHYPCGRCNISDNLPGVQLASSQEDLYPGRLSARLSARFSVILSPRLTDG